MWAMAVHSSLSAPKVKLDTLKPKETMGPYELCWCRSGKKYKWCHYRREEQKPVNVFELEAKWSRSFATAGTAYTQILPPILAAQGSSRRTPFKKRGASPRSRKPVTSSP